MAAASPVGGEGGTGRDRAEHQLLLARTRLAAGHLDSAAAHLGRAIGLDPAFGAAYAVLGDLAVAAGSSEAARELFDRVGGTSSPGHAAAGIALLAAEGQESEALELLGGVVATDPAKPWAAAPWFGPGLAASVRKASLSRAVGRFWAVIGNPAPPDVAAALAPWLELARTTVAERNDLSPGVLIRLSALARRLGARQEAVTWCITAVEHQTRSGGPTWAALTMLGFAHRAAGQPDQAIEAWTRAVALDPGRGALLLDLATTTLLRGDVQASLRWAQQAVDLDGSAPKPRAALLAARARAGVHDRAAGELAALIELADLAAAYPDVPYVRSNFSWACLGTMWLTIVPPPSEAIAADYRTVLEAQESGRPYKGRSRATYLEAPTPTTLYRARFPELAFDVVRDPDPAMLAPVTTEFGPPLWEYRDLTAVAAVAPPSPASVELLHATMQPYWSDPLAAHAAAAPLGDLDADELLGLLAHPPAPPADADPAPSRPGTPLYWHRKAQAWVCLGILHHRPDEPWPGSARRSLLMRLLFGPEDWTVDAAAFALCAAAWRFPDQRADIAEAVTRRYLHAAEALGKRPTRLHRPLAQVLLACPGVHPDVARQAREAVELRGRGPQWEVRLWHVDGG